ncbi:hypothetical protein [Streptomyces sp. SID3343]|uniref:hypothetical protein n=1 Tax=Streptomyces sp. SID3343 TaxID=2690260 RepID=UPI0013709817|nr:hypothetical protein [Streptomyces sp. SID3343]MYW03031.1 hypothetical protein [Streptomyces sp. SID3343]
MPAIRSLVDGRGKLTDGGGRLDGSAPFTPNPEDWMAYELRAFRQETSAVKRLISGCVIPQSMHRLDDRAVS